MGFAVVALVIVGAGLRIVLVSDPQGGRPSSTVAINSTRDNNPVAGQRRRASPAPHAGDHHRPAPKFRAGASISTLADDGS